MREILLLIDYKGQYWCPHKHGYTFMELDRVGEHLSRRGWGLRIRHFSEVDLRDRDYRGQVVLYQSSQDFGLHYKSYIEDVVLALQMRGAYVLPPFHLLRAHHNKVFMELLRDLCPAPQVKNIRTRHFGTLEDLERHLDELDYPVVLKSAYGDSGRGVALARDRHEARREAERLSRTLRWDNAWDNLEKTLFKPGWVRHSNHRGKLVAQTFVPGLDRDWKTIVFGHKYFVSVRPTRPDDFRASGSRGERTYPRDLPDGLLDFLEAAFTPFQAPFASVDVMHDGQDFYLGEIQFVRFGTGALIRNPHHFERQGGAWTRVDGRAEWEEEFAHCIADYLEAHPEPVGLDAPWGPVLS